MSAGAIIGIIIGVIVVILIIVYIAIYNGLVGLRNQVKNAWAQIDVQLKRRHDLIPNLVETVKGYMEHERGTLEAVTNARNLAQSLTAGSRKLSQPESQSELPGIAGRIDLHGE
jgi:LemA protein